jgi:hypothetical protein
MAATEVGVRWSDERVRGAATAADEQSGQSMEIMPGTIRSWCFAANRARGQVL